jgi:hypothetical protein
MQVLFTVYIVRLSKDSDQVHGQAILRASHFTTKQVFVAEVRHVHYFV